ncbi:MAG: class I SAM-dependent methyltransferase [Pseudomonadota bacterium]
MSGFSISWLDLREPADVKARAKPLAVEALNWLESKGSGCDSILLDLGSGTGSSLRALSALGARNIVWRLVDNDGDLLNEALKRHAKNALIEAYQADLTLVDELPFGGARLITASALFDLASREFVDSLVERLSRQRTAIYAALNYDGTTEWTPPHPLDTAVLNAFNQDQRRDKGFGNALGPDASNYLKQVLEVEGYTVAMATSPWQLDAKDHALVGELIQGIASAVRHEYGLNPKELAEWQAFRLAHANQGSCRVGHMDLLALPPTR